MMPDFDYLQAQRQEWEVYYSKIDGDHSELTTALDKLSTVVSDLETSEQEYAQYPLDDPLSVEYAIHKNHVQDSLMEIGDELRIFLTKLPERAQVASVPPLSPLRHMRGSFVGVGALTGTDRSDKSDKNGGSAQSHDSKSGHVRSERGDIPRTSDDVFSFNESLQVPQCDFSGMEDHEIASKLMQERYEIQEKLSQDQRDLERIITRLNRHQSDLNTNRQAVHRLHTKWQQHEQEIDEQIGRAINFRNVSDSALAKQQEVAIPKSRSGFCRMFQSR